MATCYAAPGGHYRAIMNNLICAGAFAVPGGGESKSKSRSKLNQIRGKSTNSRLSRQYKP